MPAIHFDFHGPRHTRARLSPIILLAGLAAWLWALNELNHVEGSRTRVDRLAQQITLLEKKRRSADAKRPTPEEERLALLRLADPVRPDAVLTALESAWRPEIALLKLDLRTSESRLTLELETRHLDSGLDFSRDLGAQPPIHTVRLREHRLKANDPAHPATLILEAGWSGARQPSVQEASSPGTEDTPS